MKYRFVQEHQNYADLAAGKVFHSLPGYPSFPVRLASEIFQQCIAIRQAQGQKQTCTLYDPCCGSGYLLSVLLYLHADALNAVVGSDVDPEAMHLAERNLALLTSEGIAARVAQIEAMLVAFGKPSHREALLSAKQMQYQLAQRHGDTVSTRLFLADATSKAMVAQGLGALKPDIVITDVPYGQHSTWSHSGSSSHVDPGSAMLDALQDVLALGAIVAVASNKAQKIAHPGYRRLTHLQIGKRRVIFLGKG